MSKYIKLEDAISKIVNTPTRVITGDLTALADRQHEIIDMLVDLPTIEVSEDCISRSALRKEMEMYGAEITLIDAAPSVVPNRAEGEWKFKKIFPNDDSEFPMGYLVCNVCGSQHTNATPCNYCDNCGTKMKGAEE